MNLVIMLKQFLPRIKNNIALFASPCSVWSSGLQMLFFKIQLTPTTMLIPNFNKIILLCNVRKPT